MLVEHVSMGCSLDYSSPLYKPHSDGVLITLPFPLTSHGGSKALLYQQEIQFYLRSNFARTNGEDAGISASKGMRLSIKKQNKTQTN